MRAKSWNDWFIHRTDEAQRLRKSKTKGILITEEGEEIPLSEAWRRGLWPINSFAIRLNDPANGPMVDTTIDRLHGKSKAQWSHDFQARLDEMILSSVGTPFDA